jgi:hypothetical protein
MRPIQKNFLAGILSVMLLMGAGPALAEESDAPDFLPMIQRNCAPNGYEASPEL